MGMLLLISIYIIPLAILAWLYWPVRRQWLIARKLAGPSCVPLIGNALQLRGSPNQILKVLQNWSAVYGKVFTIWIGPTLITMVSDPRVAQTILGNNKIRNRDQVVVGALAYFFGNGLLTSRDEEWKIHRKLITPLFSYQIMRTYIKTFGDKSRVLTERLSKVADGRDINIISYFSACSLDSLCESVMGVDSNIQLEEKNSFHDAVDRGRTLISDRILKPWLQLSWLYPLTPGGRAATSVLECANEFTAEIIAKKLETFRREKEQGTTLSTILEESDSSDEKKAVSLLDLVIESSENEGTILSAQDIRDEMKTLLISGHDTVGVALATVSILLGLYSEAQETLSQEMDDIFGEDNRQPTADDLVRMEYLDRVIKESQRLFPVNHFLPRELTEDIPLPCGRAIPAGSTAFVFTYPLHRDESSFPDPDSFLPDRWLPDRAADIHPFAYLPFSAGARNCVGQRYALLLMKVIISSLVRSFTIGTNLTMEDMSILDAGVNAPLSSNNYEIQLRKRLKHRIV